ncbi:MAG: response regulator [Alphaproteobacteria bacterium]|jgi:CheY-like chemotaxis protein
MSDKRLLAIDDEPAFAEIVRAVAEGLGYEVRVAEKADEFADIYEQFDPTVIVLDLVMPEVEGVELAHWLAHEKCRAKIVFVTGHNPHFTGSARELAEKGELKSVTTLTKPVSISELREILE